MNKLMPKVKIEHLEFELSVRTTEVSINFVLYHRLARKFYSRDYNKYNLPSPADSLYQNIQHLFQYFQQVAAQVSQNNQTNISFSEPNLILTDTYCKGQKQISIFFQLKKVSLEESVRLLKQRFKELQGQFRIVRNNFDKQIFKQQKHLDIYSKLIYKQAILFQEEQELQKRKQAEQKQIRKTRQILSNKLKHLNLLKKIGEQCCVEGQSSDFDDSGSSNLELHFSLNQRQKRDISIISNQIVVLNQNEFKPAFLRSQYSVPLYGKWIFTIKIKILQNGIKIGLTTDQSGSQTKPSQNLGIDTLNKTVFICGLQRPMQNPPMIGQDQELRVVVDREHSVVLFYKDRCMFQWIPIPFQLQTLRMYPFLEINTFDIISIQNGVKIEEL